MDHTKRLLSAALAAACLASTNPARADVDLRLWPTESQDVGPFRDLTRAERLKKHGIAASVLGMLQLTVGMGLGVAFLVDNASCKASPGCRNDGAIAYISAAGVFTGSGAIAAAAGVPMWIYGARNEKAANKAIRLSASGFGMTF